MPGLIGDEPIIASTYGVNAYQRIGKSVVAADADARTLHKRKRTLPAAVAAPVVIMTPVGSAVVFSRTTTMSPASTPPSDRFRSTQV